MTINNATPNPILLPKVKSYEPLSGELPFELPVTIRMHDDLSNIIKVVNESYGDIFAAFNASTPRSGRAEAFFIQEPGHGKEGYCVLIDDRIEIRYTYECGAFYALMTIRQLILNGSLPKCRIKDAPALSLRGYMLDVSRGKIPTLELLKNLADTLAELKYNHLELYFEGAPFIYKGYEAFSDSDAYTPLEMAEFSEYCRERMIDLTPNLNTLGHMSPWLKHKEFRNLAEKEEGAEISGMRFPPSTLNCTDPAAFQFALSLIDGLLPHFASRNINVGLDEPFELGKGKNADKASKIGVKTLYLEYVLKLYAALRERNRVMFMWGDIAARYPDIIEKLPSDIVLLEWGYQAEYPFDMRAAELKKQGCKFALCPGTSSWLSIGGITDNMLENVKNAADAARKHGALGLILTDWGDGGHVQKSFVSFPAILLASALSWSDNCSEDYLIQALDTLIFRDNSCLTGALIMDIGRYSNFEERALECRTLAMLALEFPTANKSKLKFIENKIVQMTLDMLPSRLADIYRIKMNKLKKFDLRAFDKYIANLLDRLSRSDIRGPDNKIIKDEIKNTIEIISALEHARAVKKRGAADAALADEIRRISKKYAELWLVKNRPSGMEINVCNLNALADSISPDA